MLGAKKLKTRSFNWKCLIRLVDKLINKYQMT